MSSLKCFGLEEKVVVVTGAGRGIGRRIALTHLVPAPNKQWEAAASVHSELIHRFACDGFDY